MGGGVCEKAEVGKEYARTIAIGMATADLATMVDDANFNNLDGSMGRKVPMQMGATLGMNAGECRRKKNKIKKRLGQVS